MAPTDYCGEAKHAHMYVCMFTMLYMYIATVCYVHIFKGCNFEVCSQLVICEKFLSPKDHWQNTELQSELRINDYRSLGKIRC